MTTHDPDTWHPGQVLEPGHPCPAHLRQQIAEGIRNGQQAEQDRLQHIRQREETK